MPLGRRHLRASSQARMSRRWLRSERQPWQKVANWRRYLINQILDPETVSSKLRKTLNLDPKRALIAILTVFDCEPLVCHECVEAV
jgi:hypothetical protein